MHCPVCGTEVIEDALFCHKCGQRLDATEQSTSRTIFEQAAAARQDVQPAQEEELWRGGFSSKAMLKSWIACALVSLVLLVATVLWIPWTAVWLLTVLVAIIIVWLYAVLLYLYRRLSVHYILTNQRFIHERGLLRRINNRIELLDIDDITFEQDLWDRFTGVGTIKILSHDRSDPEILLPGIEDVKKISTILDNARLAERRRRGLHVEQI